MTMQRRFCCNDLLRLGPLHLQPQHTTNLEWKWHSFLIFLLIFSLVFVSPSHVRVYGSHGKVAGKLPCGAYARRPNRRIRIEGTGEDCYGRMTMLSCFPDLDLELTTMLEDSFDKIYNAYTIRIVIPPDDTKTIMEGEKSGYSISKYHHEKSGDQLEMMKPLPRSKGRSAPR